MRTREKAGRPVRSYYSCLDGLQQDGRQPSVKGLQWDRSWGEEKRQEY